MNQYLAPQTAKLKKEIRHIVVLMLENRSFDNLLGWLYENEKPPYEQSFEGLTHGLWNPLDNVDGEGNAFTEKVPVLKAGQKVNKGKIISCPVQFNLPDPDPGEGYADTNYQLYQQYKVGALFPPAPLNMGFVQNYSDAMLYSNLIYGDEPCNPRRIMTCYTPDQTPVLSTLAKNFAVCDQYFASVPSQTLPNRSFIHAATSGGNVNNSPNPFCSAPTIYNQLQDAIDAGDSSLSWGIYGNNKFTPGKNDEPGKFSTDHFSLTRLAMTALHDSKLDGNFHTLDTFYDQCKAGSLPSYAFLEPDFGGDGQNDMHPNADIRPGEQLIADLYNAIKASPAFRETLFVITFDEHGGCYDHVAPPSAPPLDAAKTPGQEGFRFNRYGVRVPCILVNPFVPKGLIARAADYKYFDHTSVIKTVQHCFGITASLTGRSDAAPDLSGVLLLEEPRHDDIPEVRPLSWQISDDDLHINALHHLIASTLSKLSGLPLPKEDELLAFIENTYRDELGKDRKK